MRTRELRTFLYLIEGEQQPFEAPDEWFLGVDNSFRSEEELETFQEHAWLLIDDLNGLEDEDEIQAAFYSRAKLAFGEDKSSIRRFFALLYLLIFHTDSGPRWGQFVVLSGREFFIQRLTDRLSNPLAY